MVVLPPFTDLRSVQTLVDGDRLALRYGAQDVSTHDSGAYTGEISAAMLAKLGCSYVVVGHSERREYHGETDDVVNAKASRPSPRAMTPIVCVGEGLDVRKAGDSRVHARPGRRLAGRVHAAADRAAGDRLRAGLGDRHRRGRDPRGRPGGLRRDPRTARRDASGDEAADGVRILYGGSVKAATSPGSWPSRRRRGLVGGASLDADEFGGICRFYDMPTL